MIVAIVFAVVIAALIVFQLALAAGAPWGRFAWGGQHDGVLPARYRIGSVIAALVYAGIGLVVLDLAGVVDVLPNAVSQVIAWVAFGLFALGLVLNALSRSKRERYTMTPVALVLAVLAFLVALAGPVPRTFEGMVMDKGDGELPVFCTVILESYPPGCGREGSAQVADWYWSGTPDESQGMRWGVYRFDGIRDQGTITRTGSPEQLG